MTKVQETNTSKGYILVEGRLTGVREHVVTQVSVSKPTVIDENLSIWNEKYRNGVEVRYREEYVEGEIVLNAVIVSTYHAKRDGLNKASNIAEVRGEVREEVLKKLMENHVTPSVAFWCYLAGASVLKDMRDASLNIVMPIVENPACKTSQDSTIGRVFNTSTEMTVFREDLNSVLK